MSEIAKCPVCGETLSGHVDGFVECKGGCSFRCGGYALPRIAAAMECQARHDALVEAVKKMRYANSKDRWDALEWKEACAEVDRLIANESAADCKGEG